MPEKKPSAISAPKEAKPAAKSSNTLKPRDAATLIIVDTSGPYPRVLMGRRRMDVVFMPGKYVFPGGRVDEEDKAAPACQELRESELSKLLLDMKGRPSAVRARALALAAVRETFEEAGLLIGGATPAPLLGQAPGKAWQDFLVHGEAPNLAPLTLFARAITPPGRPRRYDTRFFCVERRQVTKELPIQDGELSGLDWLTIEDARSIDLPSITRVIIEDLADRLKTGQLEAPELPIPYYHHRNGIFRRQLLSLAT